MSFLNFPSFRKRAAPAGESESVGQPESSPPVTESFKKQPTDGSNAKRISVLGFTSMSFQRRDSTATGTETSSSRHSYSKLGKIGHFGKLFKDCIPTKKNQRAQQESHADTRLAASRERISETPGAHYTPDPENATKLLKVPSKFFFTVGLGTKHSSHKVVAQKASKSTPSPAPIQVGDQVGAVAARRFSRFEDGITMKEGEVTPTSHAKGLDEGDSRKDHLVNVYMTEGVPEDGTVPVIRSGKIDTEQRAQEYGELLRDVHEKTGTDKPMRAVSHQLNSFEDETKMIKSQHGLIGRLNTELSKEGIEVVHINTPTNAWHLWAKFVRKFGSVGAYIEKNWVNGEKLSREQNLESWGTYAKWLGEDLKVDLEGLDPEMEGVAPLIEAFNKFAESPGRQIIQEKQAYILKRFNQIEGAKGLIKNGGLTSQQVKDAKSQIGQWEKEIKGARSEIRDQLLLDYKDLIVLERMIEKLGNSIPAELVPVLQKITLMRQVLGAQLEVSGQELDRGSEGMAIQELNDALKIVYSLNCKSGLDRTGLWHAIKLGLRKMRKVFGAMHNFKLISDWNTTTRQYNKLLARLDDDPREATKKLNAWLNDTGDIDVKTLLKDEKIKDIEEMKSRIRDVIEFRKVVLDLLLNVSMPITVVSTGLAGLKWNMNSMIAKNLIPLNFLPPVIEDENGDQIVLLEYDKKSGEITGLTEKAQKLITVLSDLRSS